MTEKSYFQTKTNWISTETNRMIEDLRTLLFFECLNKQVFYETLNFSPNPAHLMFLYAIR